MIATSTAPTKRKDKPAAAINTINDARVVRSAIAIIIYSYLRIVGG